MLKQPLWGAAEQAADVCSKPDPSYVTKGLDLLDSFSGKDEW